NSNRAIDHLGADPVRGVARDLDLAPFHVRPQVHAGVSPDGDPPARHAATDPFHFRSVAANFQLVIRSTVLSLPLDREEISDTQLPLAEEDRQGANGGLIEPDDVIGRKKFRFEGNGRLLFESEDNHLSGELGPPNPNMTGGHSPPCVYDVFRYEQSAVCRPWTRSASTG